MRKELISLIDQNKDTWVKAAFFSDETVEKLMEVIYSRWEASEQLGMPIDYASEEELEILLDLAKRYARMSSSEARSLVLRRIYGSEQP